MAIIRSGLVTTDEAFGKKGAYLENTIKRIGWTSTPFYSTISSGAPRDRSSNVALGHSWFYDEVPDGDENNAHIEGGPMGTLQKYTGSSLKNHFQIFKLPYGVSGSEAESVRVDGKAILANQGELASIKFKKSIEMALLSETSAVARENTAGAEVAGRLGGLKSFATVNNKIDANGKDLEWGHILELLKVGFKKDAPYSILMMSDRQKDRIDALLSAKQHATMDTNFLGVNVQTIKTTSYGSNIRIMLNPFLKDDEIIAYRPEDIFVVNWRPMATKERNTTNDEILKEIIAELTLRVCTPYAFCWLTNLKV